MQEHFTSSVEVILLNLYVWKLIKFHWVYSNSMVVFMCHQTIASMVNIQSGANWTASSLIRIQ